MIDRFFIGLLIFDIKSNRQSDIMPVVLNV